MLSTDEQVFNDNQWIWDGDFRFLDRQDISGHRIGFTSYPRSGNSFLRRYCEQVTGLTTGSMISIHTSTSLQIQGLKGESHYDDITWISKSHHPFDIQLANERKVQKTFICVRHPLDVFPSYGALCNTISHGNKPDYEFHEAYPEWWTWWVKRQADQMQKFFEIILRHAAEGRTPLYIVRYEDLVSDAKGTLMGLMSYLYE